MSKSLTIVADDDLNLADFMTAKHDTKIVGWWDRAISIHLVGPHQSPPGRSTFYWAIVGETYFVARSLKALSSRIAALGMAPTDGDGA